MKQKMQETGVDFFLDIHGDEVFANCFVSGHEGTSTWNEQQAAKLKRFNKTYSRCSPDVRTDVDYGLREPGTADLGIAANKVSEEYGCFGGTLEIPFKDHGEGDAFVEGDNGRWSPQRC